MTQSPDFYNLKKMLGSRAGRRKSKIKHELSPRTSEFSGDDVSEEFDVSEACFLVLSFPVALANLNFYTSITCH
jgi:hypothetical protein